MAKRLAGLVEDVCGLTAEDRRLLRGTRLVRDPLDVLGAKLAGRAVAEPEAQEG